MADAARKNSVRGDSAAGLLHLPVASTNAPSSATMRKVRNRVAKSLSTPTSPALAKIAVNAAKTADNDAHSSHCVDAKVVLRKNTAGWPSSPKPAMHAIGRQSRSPSAGSSLHSQPSAASRSVKRENG